MSVHQLTSQNFHVVGQQRQALNINFAGNVLVLFKLDGCQGCGAFEPIFYQLAGVENRATMAVLNLSHHRDIIQQSRNTSTPIKKVPCLILYIQGRPRAVFNGKKDIPNLRKFITDVLDSAASQQQSFAPQQQSFVPQQNMYGGAQQGGAVYMPESQPPKVAARMAQHDGGMAHPSMSQQCDSDDEECLMMPDQIIPHNMPWESDYKKLTGRI